jgi:hypothetical protein
VCHHNTPTTMQPLSCCIQQDAQEQAAVPAAFCLTCLQRRGVQGQRACLPHPSKVRPAACRHPAHPGHHPPGVA